MSEEWDASNPEFHALFILKDGASVARIWGVKGCTIIAIIYDLGVTEGERDILCIFGALSTTNKIIEKCTKVLALATLQELLEEARALKPLDEHIGHASKFAERIQELLVYVSASCPFTQSGNEKWAPATSHKKNNKPYIVEIVLWYLNSGCSKHMIGHRDKLINFVSMFIGTVRFGNNHFAAIMGYGDSQMGNILILRVYYVEGLGHNLFSVGQFCDSDLEAKAVELKYLYVFGALCYPTNDFKDHGKLQLKADIGIFISYSPSKKAYQIYNKRTIQIMETMNVQFDELTQMASIQHGSRPELNGLTFRHISSGLVLNQAASTSAKPPTKNDWDLLFQPMFDEYFKPLSVVSTPISAATLLPSDTAIASSSTSIDKDAPSPSTSPNIEATNSPINYTNVELHKEEDGIEFEEMFALVARIEATRIFLAYAAHKNMVVLQMDVKTTFLKEGNDLILVQIYVVDIIFASTNLIFCDKFANQMSKRFMMSMMGQMSFFLGLQISQSPRGIFINQSKYALEMFKKYGLDQCDDVDIPMVGLSKLDEDPNRILVDPNCYREMVGSLIYLTARCPDLVFIVCMCARYQAKPTEKHLTAVKRVFRYLKGTINMGLWYPKETGFNLTAFADADHAGCQDTRCSTSKSAQFLGEKLISWSSKKHKYTAISTTKAVYISFSGCCGQILWMHSQLTDYGFNFNKIPLYSDLKSAITLSCNTMQHSRTKHIIVRYHFIKEQVKDEVVELYFVKTN
ncbi:retrovirus-related pol polyprotein from transposon TNT 1-94 [Tanacetum coccineum]